MSLRGIVPWLNAAALVAAALWVAPLSQAESVHVALDGMWSNPPATPVGALCSGHCTDVAIERLNALLDDPANDTRPFPALLQDAENHSRQSYLLPRLTDVARKTYPLDPADDPAFLRCEPYGFARQILARHDLEIRHRGRGIEMHYGEWDARRVVHMDVQGPPANLTPSRLGYSVGHWEPDALVVETWGIAPERLDGFMHSDQLHVVERYTKANDGTLWLAATFTDPMSLRQPLVMKKLWKWSPDVKIYPYTDCKPGTDFKKRVKP